MNNIESFKNIILHGGLISKEQAFTLLDADLEKLCTAANEIRAFCCGTMCDFCTVINAKGGKCSENCKFCSQSAHHNTGVDSYPLMDTAGITEAVKYNEARDITKCAVVTAGKKLSKKEVSLLADTIKEIEASTKVAMCASVGLIDYDDFSKLKASGVMRVHNNLEADSAFFPFICTTHTHNDKVSAIKAAQNAGLEVCSGGIFGMGESMLNRINMAYELRELGINNVPINILQAVEGTPLGHNAQLEYDEVLRIIAIYRFILPHSTIRMAAGRKLFHDNGRACFLAGANGAITGDMLTTTGTTIEDDFKMVEELGFTVARYA